MVCSRRHWRWLGLTPGWWVIGVLFCGSVSARADVIVVGPGQSIQAAINQAQAGDIVEVQPGTYSERIQLVGRDVTVRSTDQIGRASCRERV